MLVQQALSCQGAVGVVSAPQFWGLFHPIYRGTIADMELLFHVLLWCPKCWARAGWGLASFSATMALLGWRLTRRSERVEARLGVPIDFSTAVEWLPIPMSAGGFALAVAGVSVGLVLAYLGNWAHRLTR